MSSAASGRWGQLIAMLSCQLGNAKSLCEICGGLAASEENVVIWVCPRLVPSWPTPSNIGLSTLTVR